MGRWIQHEGFFCVIAAMTYERYVLPNGLTLLVHEDHDTPLATVNVLYKVGSRNEDPSRTGFAHLFEHLMFGGTAAVPEYDAAVDSLGGDSNAFTNTDFTNYYLTVPAQHVERALWLEADRMQGLNLTDKALRVQQQVVTEEYRQRYVNKPYGDVWLLLRPLCYQQHPYRWATIGADIKHVQEATLDDVATFFDRYYRPDNAIVAVAGNVDCHEVRAMVERLFGGIATKGSMPAATYAAEPTQHAERRMEVEREVPNEALYMAYPMCDRLHADFVVYDIISDVLANGKSSRLYNELVKRQGLFTQIDAYVTGEADNGLFVVSGYIATGVDMADAEAAVTAELQRLSTVEEAEIDKVASKYEATFVFSQYRVADRAQGLCFFESLGRLEWIDSEPQLYRQVRPEDVRRVAEQCFRPEHANVLYYRKKKDE